MTKQNLNIIILITLIALIVFIPVLVHDNNSLKKENKALLQKNKSLSEVNDSLKTINAKNLAKIEKSEELESLLFWKLNQSIGKLNQIQKDYKDEKINDVTTDDDRYNYLQSKFGK